MTSGAAFQRARRPEQKQERRDAILAAARRLALRDGVRQVSLADIADEVGIHKSALLRYFETREQIFLELTAAAWEDWVQAVRADLAPGPGPAAVPPGAAGPPGATSRVAAVLARSFAIRPLLCDLIPHTALNLERNASVAAVHRYKLTSLGAIADAAALVHRALPGLTGTECGEFVAAMASLAGSLWQVANPPPPLAELYAAEPELARACVDLEPRLRRTAEVLLAGFIPSRA